MGLFTKKSPTNRKHNNDTSAYDDAKRRLYTWDMKPFKFTNKVYISYSPLYMSAEERLDLEQEARNLGCTIIWR